MFFPEFSGAMEDFEQEFILPNPKKIYINHNRNKIIENKEEITFFLKEGIRLKVFQSNVDHLKQAINFFTQAANQGSSKGMYLIGKICEENKNFELAVQWHVLAFQNDWFENSTLAYKSSSYEALKELAKQKNDIKRIFLIYPPDLNTCEKKFGRYRALIQFYENKVAEPYLADEENNRKISRVKQELSLIIQRSPFKCQEMENYFDKGITCVEKKKYYEAKSWFLKCDSLPNALHNLGWLYEKGHVEKKLSQPNYQEAAAYYKKAKTVNSFVNLGRLYKNGIIEKIDESPNYQKAMKYFECSGHQLALDDLGTLFKEGYLGQIDGYPDYQRAKNYFEKSKSDNAYVRLGELYMQGHIGCNSPHPDYPQAESYFKLAENHKYADAYCKLGYLYLWGNIGKVDEQPDYNSAADYFKKAITASSVPFPIGYYITYYNLGVMCVRSYINQISNQPNYQMAKVYFEKSQFPEAYYSIGNLYEQGSIDSADEGPSYSKAIEYYRKSDTPWAKLAILILYQGDYVKLKNIENKKKIIKKITREIDQQVLNFSDREKYYIRGILEYYLGNWENSLLLLQNALLFGNEEEDLSDLIMEIEKNLEEEKNTEEKFDKHEEISKKEENFFIPSSENSITREILQEKNKKEKFKKKKESAFKSLQLKKKFLDFKDVSIKPSQSFTQPIKFEFLSEKDEASFQLAKQDHRKLQQILEDIQNNLWTTKGVGKPEILKYSFKGYTGCLSRRLNGKNRIIYKVIKSGSILILSWEGHYL